MILAAGLVKGDGFADEDDALRAVSKAQYHPRLAHRMPALVGPVEFGSFTRHPRLGNPGTVVWRIEEHRSRRRIASGLRNPGARAAAIFLGERRAQAPEENSASTSPSLPASTTLCQQTRDVLEALSFFLDAGVHPTWFTLNLSCPNTEDDPQGHQLEAETRQLCSAFIERLRARDLDIPLWVKISPGLAAEQYSKRLMRVFHEVGVKAVIATNTLAQPSPDDAEVQAGVGGGDLFPAALDAARNLLLEKNRHDYAVDVIACGGILDGASLRQYERPRRQSRAILVGSVYRGPFAAAIIESELCPT